MEQILTWLNENELRAFPLAESSNRTFGDNLLLDLQLVISQFSLATNPVLLKSLEYASNGSFVAIFGSSSTVVATYTIAAPLNAAYPLYSRLPSGCLAVFGEGVKDFIATAVQGTPQVVNLLVEPSRCYQFNNAWLGVTSLQTSPEKVTAVDQLAPVLPLEAVGSPTVLTGAVKLLEGFNFRVGVSQGKLDLEIGGNYGLGMNCSTSFIQPQYLDCDELVSYINGVPPDSAGNFRLAPGSNISITPGTSLDSFNDPFTEEANQHTLFVGLSFQSADLCAPVILKPSLI